MVRFATNYCTCTMFPASYLHCTQRVHIGDIYIPIKGKHVSGPFRCHWLRFLQCDFCWALSSLCIFDLLLISSQFYRSHSPFFSFRPMVARFGFPIMCSALSSQVQTSLTLPRVLNLGWNLVSTFSDGSLLEFKPLQPFPVVSTAFYRCHIDF